MDKPQGWYADPMDPAAVRWWDGTSWTDETRAMPAPVPPRRADSRRADPEPVAEDVWPDRAATPAADEGWKPQDSWVPEDRWTAEEPAPAQHDWSSEALFDFSANSNSADSFSPAPASVAATVATSDDDGSEFSFEMPPVTPTVTEQSKLPVYIATGLLAIAVLVAGGIMTFGKAAPDAAADPLITSTTSMTTAPTTRATTATTASTRTTRNVPVPPEPEPEDEDEPKASDTAESTTTTVNGSKSKEKWYASPSGTYLMTVDPDWAQSKSSEGQDRWVMKSGTGPIDDLLVTPKTMDAPVTPEQATEQVKAALPAIAKDSEIKDVTMVTSRTGATVGRIEVVPTDPKISMRSVVYVFARDLRVVVAYLRTSTRTADETTRAVEPYLMTLEVR